MSCCCWVSVGALKNYYRDRKGSVRTTQTFRLGSFISNDHGDGDENDKKPIGLDWQNNNFTGASRFYVHLLAFVARLQRERQCLISRFVEDGNTKQQFSFSFPKLWYNPLEFNCKKICQHLKNYGWNKRDRVSGSANSLFKPRFHSRRPWTW